MTSTNVVVHVDDYDTSTIGSDVRALGIRRYGRALEVLDVTDPEPGHDEVLVEVHAAGLNPVDRKIRAGQFRLITPHSFPLVLGNEMAGVVKRVGPGVTRFRVGDRVFARVDYRRLGAFAELCVVRESFLALAPARLSAVEAAGIPLVGLTVHQALLGVAGLQRGQKVFVKAGSGGVGTFAIQFAKALGAHVVTSTSTANVEWTRALGADHVIDYKRERFEDTLRDFDVVLDSVDGDDPKRTIGILKRGGHLISVAGPPDRAFARAMGLGLPLQLACAVMARRATALSRRAGTHYTFFLVKPNGAALEEVSRRVEAREISPVIDRVFPFEEAEAAFQWLARGRAKGKVILSVRPPRSSATET